MQPVSTFRGTSGEVISEYISPLTFFPAVPIALGIVLLGWFSTLFGTYAGYISQVLISVFLTMATMRVAVAASRGDMEPSNDLGEILAYSGRYLLLNLSWYLPWFAIWKLLARFESQISPLVLVNPLSLLQSPTAMLVRVLMVALMFVLPPLCLLIVLYSSSIKGMFSRHSWEWLLVQRRADLAPFWSGLLGGSLVMLLAVLLPAIILVYFGFKDSGQTGMYVAQFLIVWIASTLPQLKGKLSGVFVVHDHISLDFMEQQLPTPVTAVEPVEQPVAVKHPPEARPDLSAIEADLSELAEAALPLALESALNLEKSGQAPLRGQIEQMLILMRQGDADKSRVVAAIAIDAATQRGFNDVSLKLFEKQGLERRKLKLSSFSLEILGNIYQQKKQLLDAAWCLHAAALAAGDTIKAQKRLFQVAEMAEKSGNIKDAGTLYEILIKQYPESTLLEFAQQGVSRTRGQES